ncbi:MAG: flagellar hook-length control protein FliK [Synergistaceae bacterium]|nr:flagellar hook-length control protein FliK [Synergistaceae bacterium]
MPAGIWSFLQAQLGLQTFGVQSDSKQQELNGKGTGAFEALITEYTGNEDTGQEQANNINPKDDAQVLTLRSGGTSSFSGVNFVADDVEGSEARPTETDTWRNLFADTKRVMNTPVRKAADFAPQNDFDEGVAAVYDEPEIETLPNVNTEDNRPELAQQPEAENYSDTPATGQPDFAAPKMDVRQPEVSRMPSSQPNMAEAVEVEDHPVRQEQPKSELPNNELKSQELPLNKSPKNDTPKLTVMDSKPTITESPKTNVPVAEMSSQGLPLTESPKHDNQQTIAGDSKPIITETPKADTPDVEPGAQELPLTEASEYGTQQPIARNSKPTITESPKTNVPNTEPPSQESPLSESPKHDTVQPIMRDSKPTMTDTPHTDVPNTEPSSQELPLTESPKNDTIQPIMKDSKTVTTETPKADAPNIEPPSQELPVDESPKPDTTQPVTEDSKHIIPESPKTEGNEPQKHDVPQPVTQDSKPVIQESPKTDAPDTEPNFQELPVDESPKPETARPVAEDSRPEISESSKIDVPEYPKPESDPVSSEAPQPRVNTPKPRAFADTDDVHSEEIVNDSVTDTESDIETEQVIPDRGTVRTNIFADVKPAEVRAEDFVRQGAIPDAEELQPEPVSFEAEDITPVMPEREPAMNENPDPENLQPEETDNTQPAKPEVSSEIPKAMRQEIPTLSEPNVVEAPENIETEPETPEVPAENAKPEITPDHPVPEVKPEFGMADAPEKPSETPTVQDTEVAEIPKAPEHNESNDMPNITKPDTDIVTDTVSPEKPRETPSVHETEALEVLPELEMTDAPGNAPKPEVVQHDSNNTQVITDPDIDTVKPETPHVQETEDTEALKVPENIKPSENHEPSRTSPRATRQHVASVETRNVPEVPASEPEAVVASAETPEVPARENIQPEIMSVPAESVAHETPASDHAPRITPENREQDYGIPALDEHEDSETPEVMPEIPDADFVMAGFAQVQSAQNAQPETPVIIQADNDAAIITPDIQTANVPETPRKVNREEEPEISPSAANVIVPEVQPEITDTSSAPRAERPSRTQTQLTRRTQATAQEVRTNTQPQGTEFSRTQAQIGHEEIQQSEIPQPSQSASNESGNSDMPSTERVPLSSARTSRSTSRTDTRTETRTDTRRNEALSDFQSFFDSVTRVKRTASRVNTRPLSLRTGTYEVSGTQSQGRTLRNGIVNVVRFIRSEGVRKANIVVDPPALGRITVELTSGTSGVEASVKVASEQIRQIIQNQLTQLRDNLLQQGVQVSEFTVDVQQDNSGQGRNSGNENQRSAYSFTASDDDDETENFRADIEEGLLYWIA